MQRSGIRGGGHFLILIKTARPCKSNQSYSYLIPRGASDINDLMSLGELKKLLTRLGGMLVMDGDKPSFVMLSYENYKQMERESETEIRVNHETGVEYGHLAATGNYENLSPHLPIHSDMNVSDSGMSVEDEEVIKQLNEEVTLLRQEIKLKEMEEMLPTGDEVSG